MTAQVDDRADPGGMGRRERKKQQTRDRIARTAMTLFLERGFAQTTVAQVAEAADVSEQTVFNHFRSKEDLVYGRFEEWEDDILAAVRDRGAADDLVETYRRALFARGGLLTEPGLPARQRLVAINRMIESSPSLRRREDELYLARTDALARQLAAERTLGPVASWVVANALIGVHRALVTQVRRGLAEGIPSPELADMVTRDGSAALDLLAAGLSHSTARPAAP